MTTHEPDHTEILTPEMVLEQTKRSDESVDLLLDEILLDEAPAAGGMTEAFNDLVGYDTEHAQSLLDADQQAREKLTAIEAELRKENPGQKRRRLARERRHEHRRRLRDELYRDDRTLGQKIHDAIYGFRLDQFRATMHQHGLVFKPWQVMSLTLLFTAMVSANYYAYKAVPSIPDALNEYVTRCVSCSHSYQTTRDHFERFSSYRMHPEQYELQYGNKEPKPPACPKCHIIHNTLALTTDPKCSQLFLIAATASFKFPNDRGDIIQLCPHKHADP